MTALALSIALSGLLSAPDFSSLDAKIEAYRQKVGLPGAAILVVQDGKVLHRKFFGSYDAETRVSIASASKWVSAATVMTVVDAKLLKLDEPVSKVLTNFAQEHGTITLRQLLSHTSGLPSDNDAAKDPRSTLEESANQIAKLRLNSKPGSTFAYGGVSFQAAGRMVEVATKKSYGDVFSENLLEPLGMKSTGFGALNMSRNPQLAGGLRSTLDDYSRFLEMILGKGMFRGKRILSEASIRQMESNCTKGTQMGRASVTRRLSETSYGLGLWRDIPDGDQGVRQASSPGAFGFRPWIDRKRNLYGIFMIEDRQRNRRSVGEVFNAQVEVEKVLAAAD